MGIHRSEQEWLQMKAGVEKLIAKGMSMAEACSKYGIADGTYRVKMAKMGFNVNVGRGRRPLKDTSHLKATGFTKFVPAESVNGNGHDDIKITKGDIVVTVKTAEALAVALQGLNAGN